MNLNLEELRTDCARRQKRGIHFILASVLIWAGILAVHLAPMSIVAKDLFTFCLSTPLMPIAYMLSRLLQIDFSGKSNPLTRLGIIFSVNQIAYLLIAMWVYAAVPEKSVAVPTASLAVGLTLPPHALAAMMLGVEAVFAALLAVENKKDNQNTLQ